jgi:hypothetical protein
LLIENFSQYPARRREIPTAMQCLKDPSGSTFNNENSSFSSDRYHSGDVLGELRYEFRYVVIFCDALQATRNILGVSPLLKNSVLVVKTVLFRIISIVRVPSLCFNKDTHDNFDDEL